MADQQTKQIKIQTGVVKRILKEKVMYHKEILQNEARIEKMKKEGKDEYDIRKMGEVLQESKMMIPDCQKRLENAYEDLKSRINDAEGEQTKTEEYKEALLQLKAAEEILHSSN